MAIDTEKQILLDYQRAYYACTLFPSVEKARNIYLETRESLKNITDPVIAELVRRMFEPTADTEAETELYRLSWQYGDNTMMNGNEDAH